MFKGHKLEGESAREFAVISSSHHIQLSFMLHSRKTARNSPVMPRMCCFPDGIHALSLWRALPGSSNIIKTLLKCDSFTSLVYRTWNLVQSLSRTLIPWNFIEMNISRLREKNRQSPFLTSSLHDNHTADPAPLQNQELTLKGPSTWWTKGECLMQRKWCVRDRVWRAHLGVKAW